MKLTKLLLAAIIIGITVPSLSSCNKNRFKIPIVNKDKKRPADTTKTPVKPIDTTKTPVKPKRP